MTFVAAANAAVRVDGAREGDGQTMHLPQAQKILSGVAVAVAMLLLASIKMSCLSDETGSIKVRGKTLREKTTGNLPFHGTKARKSGRR